MEHPLKTTLLSTIRTVAPTLLALSFVGVAQAQGIYGAIIVPPHASIRGLHERQSRVLSDPPCSRKPPSSCSLNSTSCSHADGNRVCPGFGTSLSRFKRRTQRFGWRWSFPNLQVTSSLIDAFINFLFSTNSKDDALRQQMMAELERRRAEAERQHRYEEAIKLAGICSRLEATLKLSGVPSLQLKTSDDAPTSGLQLKLGDGNDGHVGIKGLPGIALNDNTGNGGSTPYGIQGLPGIYVNGPASQPSLPSSPRLSLKIGESETAPAPAAGTTAADSPSGDAPAVTGAAPDVLKMTPRQLADLAEKVNSLPAEQQQMLMDAGRASAQGNTPATLQLQQNASSSHDCGNSRYAGGRIDACANRSLTMPPP
jgi:hypothetical protein